MASKLKKCPFCGGKAQHIADGGDHWVECKDCKTTSKCYHPEAEAIAAWNRRAAPTFTRDELEKWRDAFGGRTPEEAKRDFDSVIQELIDCKDGKRREAIEIVANHISQAEKMVDIRKLVKPLQWEYDEDDEIYSAPISMYGKYLQVSVFCEKMKSGYWRVCLDGIVCDRKNPEEAKEAAQDWLVSLVANACGLESEGAQ